jgi:hypothetical protein
VTLFGAGIYATGDGSLVNDTLQLHGTGMPNGGVLYFQGTQNVAGGAGSVFGDGLLCIGGTITRLGVKINVGGASQFPEGTDPGLASLSGLTEPGTRYYQAWYRDSAAFCTPATFNLSSALPVIWFW